jgi:hypothetical protein
MELWSAVEKERDAKASRGETATNLATRDAGLDRNGVTLNDTTEPDTVAFAPRSQETAVSSDEENDEDEDGSSGRIKKSGSIASFLAALGAVARDAAFLLDPRCEDSKPFRVAASLAFFNQATCSTSVVNYAPRVLQRVGMESKDDAVLFASFVSAAKLAGVAVSMFAVDRVGRKPLLVLGSFGSGVAMVFLSVAYAARSAALVVAAMCAFMFAFSASWAGVFWVIVSELFTMRWKAPAMSAATALLFATGACVDFVFLSAAETFGAGAFALIALVCLAAGVYAARAVPETKGKTLAEIQRAFRDGSFDDARDAGGGGKYVFAWFFAPKKNAGRGRYVAMTSLEASDLGGPREEEDEERSPPSR